MWDRLFFQLIWAGYSAFQPSLGTGDDENSEDHALPGADGAEMHRRISPERWCVTRRDLELFDLQVKRAIDEGKITPSELDPFDPFDREIGPNVHTVVQQWIKPVTKAAGYMSWALMQHADGLECDLFITHGWLEGIFEFNRKVISSWPAGCKHAYVCFLSNPQLLDISDLIKCPSDSPFAKALEQATTMLVVPNRAASIYSRVWCGYEAFKGCIKQKNIVQSSRPVLKKFVVGALPLLLLISGLGFASGWYVFSRLVKPSVCVEVNSFFA